MGKKKAKKRSRKKKTSSGNSAPSQVIYLDASIVGKLIWGTPDEYNYFKENVFDKIHSNGNVSVKLSQLAIGELINTVVFQINSNRHPKVREYLNRSKNAYLKGKSLDEIKEQMIKDIIEIIQKYNIDTPPLPEKVFDVIASIRRYDNGYDIKGNDLFLLAHALADKNSTVFLTTDGPITTFSSKVIDGYRVIQKICEELEREKILSVRDAL